MFPRPRPGSGSTNDDSVALWYCTVVLTGCDGLRRPNDAVVAGAGLTVTLLPGCWKDDEAVPCEAVMLDDWPTRLAPPRPIMQTHRQHSSLSWLSSAFQFLLRLQQIITDATTDSVNCQCSEVYCQFLPHCVTCYTNRGEKWQRWADGRYTHLPNFTLTRRGDGCGRWTRGA